MGFARSQEGIENQGEAEKIAIKMQVKKLFLAISVPLDFFCKHAE